jgi:hypothetical protein
MIELESIGPVEDEVIRRIHARLAMGMEQYGPWSLDDGRMLIREANEEALDIAVYLTVECMKHEGWKP